MLFIRTEFPRNSSICQSHKDSGFEFRLETAMQPDSEKPPDKGTTRIKCPKCGHKFSCDPGWIKVSDFISCPNCGELIRVKESETD